MTATSHLVSELAGALEDLRSTDPGYNTPVWVAMRRVQNAARLAGDVIHTLNQLGAAEQELSNRYVKLRSKLTGFGALDTKHGGEDRYERTEEALDKTLAELAALRTLKSVHPER